MTFQHHAAHLEGNPERFDAGDFHLSAVQLEAKYSPHGDGEHHALDRKDWRAEVYSGETIAGYWDWVADSLQAALSEMQHADPEWAFDIIALRAPEIRDSLGAAVVEAADLHGMTQGHAGGAFKVLWSLVTQEQREAFLGHSEVAALIGAPDAYESEHGFGYSGCESDSYASLEEARRAAALDALASHEAPEEVPSFGNGPSM
ncbi:hypothetical protein [Geopseudomonas aromaticivorans]